jgi:hypothetical protein
MHGSITKTWFAAVRAVVHKNKTAARESEREMLEGRHHSKVPLATGEALTLRKDVLRPTAALRIERTNTETAGSVMKEFRARDLSSVGSTTMTISDGQGTHSTASHKERRQRKTSARPTMASPLRQRHVSGDGDEGDGLLPQGGLHLLQQAAVLGEDCRQPEVYVHVCAYVCVWERITNKTIRPTGAALASTPASPTSSNLGRPRPQTNVGDT